MKKAVHVATTTVIMLITSRFLVRIIDATVQIDDDITVLLLLLTAVNAAIGVCSYMLYRKQQR
jgi:hypothetical protein